MRVSLCRAGNQSPDADLALRRDPSYRFRRVSLRANQTYRPTYLYAPSDYEKTLVELKLDSRPWVYLEQDNVVCASPPR